MDMDQTQLQGHEQRERSQQRSLERSRPPIAVPGYEFERFLGDGAYGQVWVALQRQTGRRVAIKFYHHRGGLDWSLLSREVEKLAFLSADRYVVQLIDVGWDSDPPFYVMEYIEQGSLEDLLVQQGPLPSDEAVVLVREVAVGLAHAHAKGVLHCDLKPANVLLDVDRRPRLCDFGQSRLSSEQQPALGTLFYMAPEQADLKAVPDAGWDVYALGALFYCTLTGEPPHRNQDNLDRIEAAGDLEQRLARLSTRDQTLPAATGASARAGSRPAVGRGNRPLSRPAAGKAIRQRAKCAQRARSTWPAPSAAAVVGVGRVGASLAVAGGGAVCRPGVLHRRARF